VLSALKIAHRSAAQKGQKPAPIKNTGDLPLDHFSGWLERCMNLPKAPLGMKLLLLLTRKVSDVYLLVFGVTISRGEPAYAIICPNEILPNK
jgi:hypothetical protein